MRNDPDPHLFNPADPQPPIDPSIAEHMSTPLAFGLGALATLLVMVAILAIAARTGRVQLRWVPRTRKPVTR